MKIPMSPNPTPKPIPGFTQIGAIKVYRDWRVVDLVAAKEDTNDPWFPKYVIGAIFTAYRDLCDWASVNFRGQYS